MVTPYASPSSASASSSCRVRVTWWAPIANHDLVLSRRFLHAALDTTNYHNTTVCIPTMHYCQHDMHKAQRTTEQWALYIILLGTIGFFQGTGHY